MSTEWQPGDVAMVTDDLYGDGAHVQSVVRVLRGDGKWYGADGWVANDPDAALSIRPLVVIDAEDREQVERLVAAWEAADHAEPGPVPMTARQMRMQAALREFANPKPPKPEEPTGLGAVVEDAAGERWVQTGQDVTNPWTHGGSSANRQPREYVEIDAVRVLSEGVQP